MDLVGNGLGILGKKVRRIGRGRDEPEPLPRMETTMVREWVCRGGWLSSGAVDEVAAP